MALSSSTRRPIVGEMQAAFTRSTAVLLKRSVSCQDNNNNNNNNNNACALDWSFERELFSAVDPGSSPDRQALRSHRSSNDRRQRSEAAGIIINEKSVETITRVSSTNDDSECKDNDLASNIENVSTENTKDVHTENLVLITKVSRLGCRLEIPLIGEASQSPLSPAAIIETFRDVDKDAESGYRETEIGEYFSYDDNDFPELGSQEFRPRVAKVRGFQKETLRRSGKKWRPVGGEIQLNFHMSFLPPRSTSDQNGDAVLKDCNNQNRSSTENESDMSQNELKINSKSHESYLEERSEDEEGGSLKYQMVSDDDSCFYNDGGNYYHYDLVTFYYEKIPRCPPSSFPCEPYLPVRQRLRIRQRWKKTKARRQVKSKLCRTVENQPACRIQTHIRPCMIFRLRVGLRKSRERTPKYFDPYHNILLIFEDPYEYYDYRYDSTYEYGARHREYYDYSRYPSYEDSLYDRCRSNASRSRSRFAVDTYNADGALSRDLVNVLINLQHRDLLPEDYDLLLRLDDRVTPKTVDPGVLSTMRTEVVVEADDRSEAVCGVCMEPFEAGQTTKYLPCGHCYHETCIDRWLANSSQKCPLDGVSIDPS